MSFSVQSIADTTTQTAAIQWLWPSYLAAGKLTLLDGDPGCGKSLLTIDLAARLSRGVEMPDRHPHTAPLRTLVLNAEDDSADTIIPRLRAANADPRHVFVPSSREMPQFPDNLPQLEALIQEQQIRLVIVDSLSAFFPAKFAGGHITAVRKFLAPLVFIAMKTGVALLIVRHLNKNSNASALYRGLGSIGITGLARTVLLAQTNPSDPSCYELRVIKSNLAAVPVPLAYRLVDRDGIPVVEWLDPTPTTQPASAPPERIETPGIVRATLWLLEALAEGPKPAVELLLAAKSHGIRERTLEIAKRQLKIKSQVSRTPQGKRCWLWCPPKEPFVSELPPLEFELEPLNDPNEDPYPEELSDKAREMIDLDRLAWAKRVLGGK